MGIDIEPPMPPKRLAQRDLSSEQKKSSGFFSLFKKKKAPITTSDTASVSSAELRKKLGLDSSNALSVEKLHEQLQQEADSFSDTMSKQYEEEQKAHEESSVSTPAIDSSNSHNMVSDDLLSSPPDTPAPIPEPESESVESSLTSDKTNSSESSFPEPTPLDSVPTSVVNDEDSVHEEENIDLQKELSSSSESSSKDSMVPDFLVEESSEDKKSKPVSKNSSKSSGSWADEGDDGDSSEGGSFAKEPEPVSVDTPSDDSVFPEPVSLDDKKTEKKSSKKPSKKSSKKSTKKESKKEATAKKEKPKKEDKKSSKKAASKKSSSKKVSTPVVEKEEESVADKPITNLVEDSPVEKEESNSDSKVPDFLVSDQDSDVSSKVQEPALDSNSNSDNSWLDDSLDVSTPTPSSFTDEPEMISSDPVPIPESIDFNSENNDINSSTINLDSEKAEAFAKELSSSTDSVAKEHSIPAPASPFDLNPAPDLSKEPVVDDFPEPTLTNFEEPKLKKKGFLSKLFGNKKSSPKKDALMDLSNKVPAPTPSLSPDPLDFDSTKKQTSDSAGSDSSPSADLPLNDTSNSILDDSIPIEANDPYLETSAISNKRVSTLNSIIESGKLDVLFVDKNGSVASNEDEIVESKLNSDEEAFDEEADKTRKHHKYISSFAHDIDIIITAAKEAADSGDLLLAKKKYNEAKDLYAASELEDHTRELLYVTLKDLFDDIHLKLLEQQAQELLGK